MKTLMTINGLTLLLPDTTTDKAIMDLITNLRGARDALTRYRMARPSE